MTKTKKIICAVLVLAVITSAGAYAFSVITANESQKNIQFVQDHVFTVGQYFLMGKYQEEPILWRCIDNTDENGMLMISDKVLCHKLFDIRNSNEPGSSYNNTFDSTAFSMWYGCVLRAWMNSTAPAGKVKWPRDNPPSQNMVQFGGIGYDDEKGFLSNDNFSPTEKSLMKTVSQWNLLNYSFREYATNGATESYSLEKNNRDYGESGGYGGSIEALRENPYDGFMHMVTDTMFLIDGMQLIKLVDCYGIQEAEKASYAQEESKLFDESRKLNSNRYWLRSPITFGGGHINFGSVTTDGSFYRDCDVRISNVGVRPAFYLNEKNVMIKSGSGTKEDPYVIDGASAQNSIAVFCNGKELEFPQPPVLENGRVLVPMRAIFEALGAEVSWDGNTRTVTATRGEDSVTLQIGNSAMEKNDEQVSLDVVPRLVNNSTLVPVRAVAEGLNAQVKWISALQRVVVTYSPDVVNQNPPTNFGRYDFSDL